MEDFRSDRMDSREGRGFAASVWDSYSKAVNRAALPIVEPFAKAYGAKVAVDLAGFWLIWHLHGGFDGLVKLGMPEVTIYRKIKRFRQAYGKHPDELMFPGVSLDAAEYMHRGKAKKRKHGKRREGRA
ncbi:MAG: hypothetical protein ACYDCC_01690 [Actinomycetota bacterium]